MVYAKTWSQLGIPGSYSLDTGHMQRKFLFYQRTCLYGIHMITLLRFTTIVGLTH
jgi:hypothetical protein